MKSQPIYESTKVAEPFPLDGKIYLNNERVLITTTAAMGLLRKDLTDMVGKKRMNQFLVRYGWSVGVHDATQVLKSKQYTSFNEMLMAGTKMHMEKGHVHVQTKVLEFNPHKKTFYMEGLWNHSYEAEEHKTIFGECDGPTCFTLVGYASGYLSTILDMLVLLKEVKCEGKGDTFCHWVAKPAADWGTEVDQEMFDFEETSMIKELESAYEKIKEERDLLTSSYTIHKRLSKELVNGNNLQSVANVLLETLDAPVMIEDHQFNLIAASGLNENLQHEYNEQMKSFEKLKKYKDLQLEFQKDFKAQQVQIDKKHFRLMIPILINQKIKGYCSLVRPMNEFSMLEHMIIERTSVVCAMYLLNERTALMAEQRMRGNILEDLLESERSEQELIKLGHIVELDLLKPFHILVINSSHMEQNLTKNMERKACIISSLSEYFKKRSMHVLLTSKSNNIVLYVPNDSLLNCNNQIKEFAQDVIAFCMEMYPKQTFFAGISTSKNKVEQPKNQYEEALAALNMCTKSKMITGYEELGIIGILMQTGDKEAIRKYSMQELEDLLEYDRRKGMDLTKTLYHYILNGGNLEQTANGMALSISGLRYRIEKIKDLLSVDIRQPAVSYPLFLAIQTLIVLDVIQFN